MKTPKISVLLCVYNPDIYQLNEAVKSIIGQTYADWEMILYDDGSDDGIAQQIEDISKADTRITYVRNTNHHSLAYGLNEAIEKSQGEYLARMDADDISYPKRFEKQIKFLEEHTEYEYLGSNIEIIDDNNKIYGIRKFPESPTKENFLDYSPYAHPTLMFRKECLVRNGGYINDEKALRGEDYELLMRLHSRNERGFNIEEPLYKYRESVDKKNKHKLSIQLNEVKIRRNGFKALGLSGIKTFPYVIKPLVVWIAPDFVIRKVRLKNTIEIKENG